MKRAWALAATLVLALLPSTLQAQQTISALAPVEIVLDGRQELVGVAVASDGTLYVSDRAAGIVYRLTPLGTLTLAVAGLSRPAGLALDAAGRLLIAEEMAGRVLRLEPNGTLTVLATGIKTPRWLAVSPDGSLYVSAHRLAAPDGPDVTEGREILRLVPGVSLTVVATGIRRLEGLARLNGTLVAATKGLESEPDSPGKLLQYPILADGSLGTPTALVNIGLKQPVGLVLDRLAALYVSTKELTTEIDTAKRAIGKVHPDARLSAFAEQLGDPQGMALGPDGSLYLADGKAGRLLRFRAPPAPTLNALPASTNQSPFTVTGTTEANARVDGFVNDAATPVTTTATAAGTFSLALTLAANALNTLEVFATPHAGNGLTTAPAQATLTHDNIAPSVTFLQPPGGAFVRQTVTVQAQATDSGSGVASVELRADGQPLTPTLSPAPPAPSVTATAAWNTTGLLDGTRTLTATATDQAGNSASVTRSVIVDNTPPDTQITGGPTGEIGETTAAFTFTGTDNLTPAGSLLFAWSLDGAPFTAFSTATSVTFTNLAEVPHTFQVKARDLAGNEDPTPASRSFTVALKPEITSVTPASGPVGTFVTLTGARFLPGPTQVAFNGVAATLYSLTATTITTTVPLGATSGLLTGTTPKGTGSRLFDVTSSGDFSLAASPATVRAIAGDQGSAFVQAGGSGSFTSLVSLGVSTAPAGITPSLGSGLIAPGGGTDLSFLVASTVTPGSYAFTVTGQAEVDGQLLTRSASITLEILAPTTQAVTGRVLTADTVPQPIPGVTVVLGSAFTLTDAGGNFLLPAPPAGANMLLVDGRTASTATAQFPPVEVNISVNASGPTRVPFIVFLPRLDTAPP